MTTESEIRTVVDASAVLAWIFDERGSDVVDRVLDVSGISAVNFAEVLYKCHERGMDEAETEGDLAAYGLRLLPFGGDEARRVLDVKRAEDRVGVSLSLADRCCLATALGWKVPVVASDTAWEALELDVEVMPFR